MKRILLLTSIIEPYIDTSAEIILNIAQSLKQMGNEIICIGYDIGSCEEYEIIYESINVHLLPPSEFIEQNMRVKKRYKGMCQLAMNKLIISSRNLQKIIHLKHFPVFDLKQSKIIQKKLDSLYKQWKFDVVIAAGKPFYNIAAVEEFKRNNSNVFCGAFFLDLLTSMVKPALLPKPFYSQLLNRADERYTDIFDFIILPPKGEERLKKKKYCNKPEKYFFVDFPTFINRKSKCVKNEIKNEIKMIYAGTLSRNYRNPKSLFHYLRCVSRQMKKMIILQLYGLNDCEDIISEFNEEYFTIKSYGMQSKDIIKLEEERSDVLINISNELPDAVPSKIFELFSFCKPIINYVFVDNDPSLPYFDEYPLECRIIDNHEKNVNEKKLKLFLENHLNDRVDYNQIKKIYYKNTPEYVGKKILNLVENLDYSE